jgi:hypothetical protein
MDRQGFVQVIIQKNAFQSRVRHELNLLGVMRIEAESDFKSLLVNEVMNLSNLIRLLVNKDHILRLGLSQDYFE